MKGDPGRHHWRGPGRPLLARLLKVHGVEMSSSRARSRSYVENRIRAGVLEQGTVGLLEEAGVAGVPPRRLVHYWRGIGSAVDAASTSASLSARPSPSMDRPKSPRTIAARLPWRRPDCLAGAGRRHRRYLNSSRPAHLIPRSPAKDGELICDFTRRMRMAFTGSVDQPRRSRCGKPSSASSFRLGRYPGRVPPCSPELIYAGHDHGFALASMPLADAQPLLPAMRSGRQVSKNGPTRHMG